MAEPIFTLPDAWLGGFYTLAINLGERSDEHSWDALNALPSYPLLKGWYKDRSREPHEQPRVVQSEAIEDQYLGVLTLPNGNRLACGCFVFHSKHEPDWLEFFLPLGSIGRLYAIGSFPFGGSAGYTDWRKEIDLALVDVATHLYQHIPFRAGLIDFEPDVNDLDELYWSSVAELPPEKPRYGLLWSGAAGLEWHPPK